jgi:hypothetical protein
MAGADCRGRTQQDVCVHGNRPRTPPCSASSRARVRACAGAPSGLCLLCVCSVPRLVPCLLTGMTLFKALTAAWPHASCLLPPASSLLPPPSSLLPLPSSLVPPLSLPCPSLVPPSPSRLLVCLSCWHRSRSWKEQATTPWSCLRQQGA